MNIDMKKLRRITDSGNLFITLEVVEECEINQVDCNECTNNGSFENDMHCGECINYKLLENHFKQKPKEWYEDESNFPCLCWASDNSEIVTSINGYICLIVRYETRNALFVDTSGDKLDYATPLTKEEVLKYCLGEK